MRSQQARLSFSAGVMSPRLSLRADQDRYSSGLEQSTNWIVSPQGGAIFRQGFEFIEETNENRMFQWHNGGNESDIIIEVLPSGEVHFHAGDIAYPSIQLDDPYSALELEELYFTNQETTGVLVHANHTPVYLTLQLDDTITHEQLAAGLIPNVDYDDAHAPGAADNVDADYVIKYVDGPVDGPWVTGQLFVMSYGGYDAVGEDYEMLNLVFTYSGDGGGLGEETRLELMRGLESIELINVLGTTISVVHDGGNQWTATVAGNNGGKELILTPRTTGGTDRTIAVDKTITNGANKEPSWSYPTVVEHTFALAGTVSVTAGTPDVTGAVTTFLTDFTVGDYIEIGTESHKILSITDDTTLTLETNHVTGATNTAYKRLGYYQCLAPHRSMAGTGPDTNEPDVGDDWALFWVKLDTKPPTYDWQYPAKNIWVDDKIYSPGSRGFPTVTVFYQQRCILMANPGITMGVWGSRIGEYQDFSLGPNDDDPWFYAIDTSDTPTIKWAEAQRNLTLGTSAGDFSMGGEVTISPSDVNAFKQNNSRSLHTRAVTLNTDIIHIEQGGEKVHSTSYLETRDALTSNDISLVAEHLLQRKIKRIVILQTPEKIAIALADDGTLIGFTYNNTRGDYRDVSTYAWWEIESQGHVHDIASHYSIVTKEDSLYLTISYNYSEAGPNKYNLEHMPYPSRTFTQRVTQTSPILLLGPTLTAQGVVLLDSWIEGTAVSNVIAGLEHLDGMEVAALVDDAWTGTYTVEGGQITLDDTNISGSEPYNGVSAVGLLYKGTLKTLEFVAGNQRGVGFGTKRKWNRLFVRTLDSSLPVINGSLPPDRTPDTLMDIPEVVRMGLVDHEMRNLGWGDGSVLIEQDRPYPCNVLGLYGEFNANNS